MATPIIAQGGEGIKGEGPTDTNPCGCVVSKPTKSSGRRVIARCAEGERLWDELRDARDERRESLQYSAHGRRRGARTREGREILDRFVAARDDFHRHVFGEVI